MDLALLHGHIKALRRWHINTTQAEAMIIIHRLGTARPRDICEETGMSPAVCCAALKNLARRRIIHRPRRPLKDKRAAPAKLLTYGKSILRGITTPQAGDPS